MHQTFKLFLTTARSQVSKTFGIETVVPGHYLYKLEHFSLFVTHQFIITDYTWQTRVKITALVQTTRVIADIPHVPRLWSGAGGILQFSDFLGGPVGQGLGLAGPAPPTHS